MRAVYLAAPPTARANVIPPRRRSTPAGSEILNPTRRFWQLVGKLRARSLTELRERGAQLLWAAGERAGAVDRTPGVPGADLRRIAEELGGRESPAFFAGVRDGASAAVLRAPEHADTLASLVAAADRAVQGRFDLLGYTDLSFGDPIDWHLDPVHGRRTPRRHWSRIDYLDAATHGDHKIIWELNRHQHFVLLGRAYQVRGDDRYAVAFARQVNGWMDGNPPKLGINWASSLEVAFRATSWLWALELFRGAASLDTALIERMLGFLYLHGRHLERYLSTYFSPNTHLTGEALGLFYLGVMLPDLPGAGGWLRRGWEILEQQLPTQVHEDGVYFEQATYYHRYTVDFYLHAILLAQANGLAVPPSTLRRLERAAEHLADLARPDGTIPLIGDDDGGRVTALEERRPADVRAALGTAAIVLTRPELAAVAGTATQEVLWLVGPERFRRARAEASGPAPSHHSRLYPIGGYAVMRSGWGSEAHHAVVDTGPLGALHAGHAHADTLSLEIAAYGRPVVVDPGTYTYTVSAGDRDWFRHSAMHNTVTVDGRSSSVPAGPFSWATRASAHVEAWWSGRLIDYLQASHDGFSRLPSPVLHRRQVWFVRDGYWVVVDTILSKGTHESTAHLHFAPGTLVSHTSPTSARLMPAGASGGLLVTLAGDVDTVEWGEGWVSSAYGVRERAPTVRMTTVGGGRRELVTILVPSNRLDSVAVRELPCEGGRALAVDRPGTQDLLLLAGTAATRFGDVRLEAGAALLRRTAPDGPIEAVALLGGGSLVAGPLSVTAPGSFEAVLGQAGWATSGAGTIIG